MEARIRQYCEAMEHYIQGIKYNGQIGRDPGWRKHVKRYRDLRYRTIKNYRAACERDPELVDEYVLQRKMGAGPICTYCGRFGHMSRSCAQRRLTAMKAKRTVLFEQLAEEYEQDFLTMDYDM